MKKSLLFLGLLGLSSQLHAQSPWTLVNTSGVNIFGAYNVTDLSTLSPTLAWGITSEKLATGTSIPGTYIVTNNAAGDQFDFGGIAVTGNATVINISGISATAAVAGTFPSTPSTGTPAGYGGEIVKTIDRGQNWLKKTTAAQFSNGFCNWVHMFNATTGVALGDPTGGTFEILRTTNGGDSWTRLSAGVPAPLNADEYGNAGAFFASGNTIWTGLASAVGTNPVRVLKSTDQGLTWTASAIIPNIVGAVSNLAFKDANNGIAYGYTIVSGAITALNVARTSDGGATWSAITPARTATGSFFRNDIDAVNGVYYSVGPRYPLSSPQVPEDFGSSYSTDGINWTNLTVSSGPSTGYFFKIDLIPGAAANTTAGYGGIFTETNGSGGIYKFARTVTSTRDAALQNALRAYPNPSASGLFKVDLGSELKAGAQLTVVDALGRQVAAQALTASVVGSRTLNLDLSGEKTGVYTLQVRTDAGIATQKLVIN